MDYRIHHFGDNAIMIELGNEINPKILDKITLISNFLDSQQLDWLIEYIPAYTTITIFYDPFKLVATDGTCISPFQLVADVITQLLGRLPKKKNTENRLVEIPVCYGGEYGPDLTEVAAVNGLSIEEVIRIHSSAEYLVYMIGFAPGFPYIGGMSEKIATPRKATPRLKIPAGSVGIAGKQTGVYPLETPGGWQLIGRTPVRLFDPDKESPSLLKTGDKIRFKPITPEAFFAIEEGSNV